MVLRVITIFVSSVLLAFAYNMFLLPHKVLSGGVTGIAMILGLVSPVDTGMIIFLINIPIIIVGYKKLGKEFIVLSLFSVAVTSLSMQFIPLREIAQDPLLCSIFGGVIAGIATGLIFRASGSTAGFDIIGMIMNLKKEVPLGGLLFAMNAVVVFISGFIFDWDLAMYTMASIYVTGKVIDAIHTRHVKLTLMIITGKGEEVKQKLLSCSFRGITVLEGEGAYSREQRKVLITVITRYELPKVNPKSVKSIRKPLSTSPRPLDVMGLFHRQAV
ncbi:membrane protein [Marinithermofilum abyssi]|uniref:Membrane protein n=1 Tax=Marinithermofilum abyssi TaxID=1571185 RepID=A0A8J2VEY2_9BACL|nr:membrane protein [Marinithermofilum abyssi]